MSDVFISYANPDRERARQIANTLSARGWSVWWDRKIKAGQTFDEVIERELDTAKHIVVLWSEASVASEWVRNEAAVAAQRRVLVPVLLDSVKVPLEFRRRQTADLVGWNGDPSHAGMQTLLEALEGTVSAVPSQGRSPTPAGKARQISSWLLAGATGFLLGCVATYFIAGGSGRLERSAAQIRTQPMGRSSSAPAPGTAPSGPSTAMLPAAKASLPVNLEVNAKGVYLDVVGFVRAGELITLEWILRNTSEQRVQVCSHASQAALIDQVSGESWRALHYGGPVAGCETIAGGGQSGAWAKFKAGSAENRRFSISLPVLPSSPELPAPQLSPK
jgi:hypothetical protein